MWIVDAAMRVQLGTEVHSSGSFVEELLQPGITQLVFRSVFLFIAVAFGWSLWRCNWRKRELRALEDAIIAFHRQLDSPAMRIVSHIRMLQSRPSVTRDDVARAVPPENQIWPFLLAFTNTDRHSSWAVLNPLIASLFFYAHLHFKVILALVPHENVVQP